MDIVKLCELSERCKLLERELRELTIPQMTDIEQVERIYNLFTTYCNRVGVEVQGKQGRRLFIAVILSLYSPMVLAGGGRLVKGLRNEVQRVMKYQTPEAVSVGIRYVVSDYSIYARFRNEVSVVCSFVEENIKR